MRRVIILNAKGGCGKTTIATNLASCYATRSKTALIDYDPQGSSLQWLRARRAELPAIHGVAIHDSSRVPLAGAWQMRVPRDVQRVVVDVPAGIRAIDLVGRITSHDALLIPIQPSAMDVRSTADFVRDLLMVAKLKPGEHRVAFVVNRVRRNSQFFQAMQRFLDSTRIPVVAQLRDSQNYALAVEQGIGVCELSPLQSHLERSAWAAILDWLEAGAAADPLQPPAAAAPAAQRAAAPIPKFLTANWSTSGGGEEASTPAPKLN